MEAQQSEAGGVQRAGARAQPFYFPDCPSELPVNGRLRMASPELPFIEFVPCDLYCVGDSTCSIHILTTALRGQYCYYSHFTD